jgi:cytochrome c oxidase assembly protein subunit 15
MHGSLIPVGLDWSGGVWSMLNNDPYVIHFIHRWWAWVAVGFLIVLARRIRGQCRKASIAIHSAYGVQLLLGIATVVTGVSIHYAVLHQAVGALVVISTVWGMHLLGRNPAVVGSRD